MSTINVDNKLEDECNRLLIKVLGDMSWPYVRTMIETDGEADGEDKDTFLMKCTQDVYDGMIKWLEKGEHDKYAEEMDALFEDDAMEERIVYNYTVLCARKEAKYEKDNATKTRKRAQARALKMQEELASRDSADAPAAGAPEGPSAGAPEHKDQCKAPRKALRQGAPRALPEAGEKKRKRVVSDNEEAPSPANAAGALEPPEDPEAAAKREARRAKSILDAASRKRRTELARRFNPVVREVARTLKLDTNVVDAVTPRELHNKASLYVFGDEELDTTYQEWLSGRFKKCTLDYVTNAWLDTKFPLPKPAPAAAGPRTSRDVAMAERPATPVTLCTTVTTPVTTPVTPGRATARSSPAPPDSPDTPVTPRTPVTPGRAVPRDSLLAELQGDSSAEVLEILRGDAAAADTAAADAAHA